MDNSIKKDKSIVLPMILIFISLTIVLVLLLTVFNRSRDLPYDPSLYLPSEILIEKSVTDKEYPTEEDVCTVNEGAIIECKMLSSEPDYIFLKQVTAMDDSMSEIEYIEKWVEESDNNWKLNEELFRFKCHEGRGHTDWGIEPCL